MTAYNYGLGEARARAELIGVDGNRGGSFIMRDSAGANDRIPIRLQTLDTVLDDLAEDITLIKIDVEGYEAQVLRGATNTLCRHQPVVVFEQHQTEFCDGSTPSINFLRSLGYSICWAEYPREHTKYSLVREIRKLLDKINRRRPNIVFGLDIPKKSHSMMVAIPKHLKDSLGVTE
ncbi:FkbM family methyltransferase [Thalassobacter stenotrophicus]|uniref:FkbM family methyltransferase n=1 Tax=Thalassobacter stenotrophicus TaxID=266809 RepID=UPI000D5CF29D|nr:hypothetical protein DD557_11770 [Thalassobacter stenotrophicus]